MVPKELANTLRTKVLRCSSMYREERIKFFLVGGLEETVCNNACTHQNWNSSEPPTQLVRNPDTVMKIAYYHSFSTSSPSRPSKSASSDRNRGSRTSQAVELRDTGSSLQV